ncbi:MAG TPA: helicase, partial [Acidobacteriota bacterium]|nr:helicase [Acidobacteriota bacterium]
MQFSLTTQTASLSVGEFSDFSLGPREGGGGSAGLWRAQLGQHWHNELRAQTERSHTRDGVLASDVAFEIPIEGRLVHRGWTLSLGGRIDQLVGTTLREIKTVTRPLPADEAELRADYGSYFLQLATYVVLARNSNLPGGRRSIVAANSSALRAELIFVEAASGLSQTLTLTAFDEALVHHQLDAVVEFLELQLRAAERRHRLSFHSPFPSLRPGQETIQRDLTTAFHGPSAADQSKIESSPKGLSHRKSNIVFLEAPTGYGKTGCALEFALGELKTGHYDRLIWLTGKSTGQLQVIETLRRMTTNAGDLAFWQVRNKGEHCVNVEFHCVRDNCTFLAGAEERWPGSGLARFYRDPSQRHDLDTLRAAGREALICPYEITRTALAFNDVWIGDYNYVFAPDNRGLFFDQPGFDAARTLLVIDEAHNLPSRVADAYSHTAHDRDVRALLAELDHQRAPTPLVLAVETWARTLASV